jgi:hypothetical protein
VARFCQHCNVTSGCIREGAFLLNQVTVSCSKKSLRNGISYLVTLVYTSHSLLVLSGNLHSLLRACTV